MTAVATAAVGERVVHKTFPPITRHTLALYCGASGDHNPIHVDLDFARAAGFPDVFSHGMLIMAYLGQALTDAVAPGAIRSFSTRFAAITQLGTQLTCEGDVAELFEAMGEKRVRLSLTPRMRRARSSSPAKPSLPSEEFDMQDLKNKVALVSGSGRGIGRAIALKLARHGAKVLVNDVDEEPGRAVAEEIKSAGGEAVAINGSVTDQGFPDRFVGAAMESFGGLDVIVNNAGYTWDSTIQKMTDEQLQAMLDVHLVAPFRILRAAAEPIRAMAKREAQPVKRRSGRS